MDAKLKDAIMRAVKEEPPGSDLRPIPQHDKVAITVSNYLCAGLRACGVLVDLEGVAERCVVGRKALGHDATFGRVGFA